VFENRVLRRIFRPKREEVVGSWRRLHNEEFHKLHTTKYYYGDKIMKVGMGRACITHGRDEKWIQKFFLKT
jgi:hypothetical protein